MNFTRILTLCVGLAVSAAVVVPVSEVFAQPEGQREGGRRGGQGGRGGFGGMGGGMGAGMMGDMMGGQQISTRQLEKYATLISLTADQKDVVKVLHEGYQAQVRDLQESVREEMEKLRDEMRETRDPAVFESMREAGEKARVEGRKIETAFLSDVKDVLTPEQAEKWPRVERAIRRDQSIRRGVLSGERVDLTELVSDLKLDETAAAAVEPVMEQYEAELDRAIIERNQQFESAMAQFQELRRNGDMAKAQEVMAKGREAAAKVRDVNRKYARSIGESLPTEQRSKFDNAFRQASFPDVYRQGMSARSIEAALKFEDLEPTQADAIEALKSRYTREVDAINAKLMGEIEKNEMEMTIDRMFQGGGNETLVELRRQKRDLDQTTLDALRKELKPAQIERLPQPERRNDWGGDGEGRRRMRGGQNAEQET